MFRILSNSLTGTNKSNPYRNNNHLLTKKLSENQRRPRKNMAKRSPAKAGKWPNGKRQTIWPAVEADNSNCPQFIT